MSALVRDLLAMWRHTETVDALARATRTGRVQQAQPQRARTATPSSGASTTT